MGQANLFEYLGKYYNAGITLGMEPVVILDTCAIIDLESAHRRVYSYPHAHTFLDNIETSAGGKVRFIIPEIIKEEVKKHNQSYIAGRPEISDQTLKRILGYNQDQGIQSFLKNNYELIDQARYFLRGMYLEKMKGKKLNRDPISREDWALIDIAIGYAILGEQMFNENNKKGLIKRLTNCPKIAVLSADEHVLWTIDSAFNEPDMVGLADYLRPINTRDYGLIPK